MGGARHAKPRAGLPPAVQWCHEVEGVLRALERMANREAVHGEGWINKMIAYYGKRLNALLKAEPATWKHAGAHYRERLKFSHLA